MQLPAPHVPAHLRRYVVEQDYAEYTAVDQAVWRFVLLQTYSRLCDTAHAAYREGLASTGISVERIPSIGEMNEKLSRFGWSAVCVDGFIPPRAFQEFQARGILPIAAEVRTRAHLVYTPAPDIIHEAAGHAPILPDPVFSAYVRRMGELGRRAFTLPEDDSVYQAIHGLSEIKESPGASAEQVADAERALSAVLGQLGAPSEVARLSRLYWWTAEYGLVGSVDDYKIYGAGILSSLWESHACHARSVRKLPLDEGCIEFGYDITQPQPQLFVVPDFEALHAVAERVADTLAFKRGGPVALAAALASQDLASVKTSSGAWLMGVLAEVAPNLVKPAWLRFNESISVAWDGELALELPILRDVGRVLPVGPLADSSELVELTQSGLDRFRDGVSGRHRLTFARGVSVEGRLERGHWHQGRLIALAFSDARLERAGLPALALERYLLVPVGEVVTVEAGAADVAYHPETDYSNARVPKPRIMSAREQALIDLYQQARRAHAQGVAGVSGSFPEVHARLAREFPEEWLLRWNLLESLIKVGVHSPLVERLQTELERLELHYARREPIASGLRYLSGSVAA